MVCLCDTELKSDRFIEMDVTPLPPLKMSCFDPYLEETTTTRCSYGGSGHVVKEEPLMQEDCGLMALLFYDRCLNCCNSL